MRAVTFLSVAALAAGIVIPDEVMAVQLALQPVEAKAEASADVSGWEVAVSAFETLDSDSLLDLLHSPESFDDEGNDEDPHHPPPRSPDHPPPGHPSPPHHPPPHHPPPHHGPPHHGPPHHGPHHHHEVNKTVLDILAASNHTRIFSYLVRTYSPTLASLLNATAKEPGNYTVFAPLDSGFKRLHRHFKRHHPDEKPKRPSNETIEKFLAYHVVEGKKPFHALFVMNTLPTLLDGGEELGGMQRIRLNHGLFGVHVNFMAKIMFPNHPSSNGLLHFLSLPLLPPPSQLKLISLLPSHFSTLSLALTKTGLDEDLASLSKTGGTFFAPSNHAFAVLGAKINAFLFNTEKGLKILKALMKYHFVADQTLYTDAYYRPGNDDKSMSMSALATSNTDAVWKDVREEEIEAGFGVESEMSSIFPGKSYHVDLPTLLDDKSLGVDIRRGPLGTRMLINKSVPIGLTDVLASDGVLHLPRRVILPPHPHRKPSDDDNEKEMTVDELLERMAPVVDEQEGIDEL